MKMFVSLMALLLMVALIGPFVLKRPDGKNWMDVSELAPDIEVKGSFAQLKLKAYRWFNQLRRGQGDANAGKTKVYRWQAADGSWQFSDHPATNVKADTVWIDPNTNLIAPPPERKKPEAEKPAATNVAMPMSLNPARVEKLIKDAEAVQGLMDKRYNEIDQLSQ